MRHNANFIILLSALLLCLSPSAWGQGTQVEFGKNRVQFHQDYADWSKYESDNFITYWYGEGRNIGQAVVQIAEYDFSRIQNVLEHRINDKLQIIVYTDLSDLKQSNIGSEEAFVNTSGRTKIEGNKIFVYFNGDHTHLRRQVREGIASVYLEAMLFGSNLQEIVQNAVMLNLPQWFKVGLISYASENWSTEQDNKLRDLILSGQFESFDELAEAFPYLAGHSLWYFIGEHFGKPTVSNLLYLTRINRSVESGFLYVLGSSFEVVTDSWLRYFRQRYTNEVASKSPPALPEVTIKNKRNLPITQVKLSPDGQQLIYVLNEIGKYKVYHLDLITGERKKIFRHGFRNPFQATDYNYPLISWSPTGLELAILYEKRDIPRLLIYDLATGKSKEEPLDPQYQRVYDMDYLNPGNLVFSATVRGFSDIFLYFIATRQTQRITNDFWDDLDVRVVNIRDQKGIVFRSNRPDTLIRTERLDSILPIQNFDLFYYDMEERPDELVRITDTPFASEKMPTPVDTNYIAFLSDASGIYNRHVAYLEDYIHHFEQVITLDDGSEIVLHADSTLESLDTALIDTIVIQPVIKTRAKTSVTTDFDRNLIRHDIAPRAGRVAQLSMRNFQYQITAGPLSLDTLTVATPTRYRINRGREMGIDLPSVPGQAEEERIVPPAPAPPSIPPPSILTDPADSLGHADEDRPEYLFQTEFDDRTPPEEADEAPAPSESEPAAVEEEEDVSDIALLRGARPTYREVYRQPDMYRFRPGRITPYRLEFRTNYVTTRLDNSLLFEGLESFDVDQDVFSFPPPGILLKANFIDLFEDYEFEGGVRVPTTFDGTEYFLVFRNKKKRLDKSFAFYRKARRLNINDRSSFTGDAFRVRNTILLGQAQLRYPLDIFRSLGATLTVRGDKITNLASEFRNLERPSQTEQRIGLRLEYVFDNTLDVSPNIKNGSRYKVYANVVKKFDLEILDGFNLSFDDGFMTILGVDARHYQRLLKWSVLAARFSAATSFGSETMLYFLGGTEGWLFPRSNDDIPIPSEENIAFKALAAPMRGFRNNIRNGSSYALANAELRMPLLRYLFPRSSSGLVRNFQVVGFFDVGTAWVGTTPFSDENPLNTTTISRGELVEVKVNFFRDPIVAGYGIGARAMLFGYFLRVDYAWGIETKVVQDPQLYFSLGFDF